MPRKNESNNNTDHFRVLVKECISAYEKLSNDGLALDYCKVADRKLRALVLSDSEYKSETRSIYAQQRLEEINEIEHLASLAAGEDKKEDEEDDNYYAPRDGVRPPSKKMETIDRDMLNMRFKAAQMKRELRSEMTKTEGDHESDSTNFMFLSVAREELEKTINIELNYGSDDADIDALIGIEKEEVPVGTAGKLQTKGKTKVILEEEDAFTIMPDGEVVEK